jgi:Ser/Thr protein kinase RdoA (MazF antagonist)
MNTTDEKLKQVCEAFRIQGTYQSYEEIKMGNVNQTYKVNYLWSDGKAKSYIVQAVNTYVFKNPVQVMENIDKVTEYIHAKKPNRTSLHFHHTAKRKTYFFDENGFWRLFNYIPSTTYNTTSDMSVIRNAGEAFGEFQTLLADFDAAQLYETIPDFHNTKKRYEKLEADAAADPCGRVQAVRDELSWLLSIKKQACRMTELYEQGKLPLRVTHNDTKINNVLFDSKSGEALVVIDLDTVMPGLVGHDFGDAIRFVANYVEEDSPEYEKAGINMEVFRAFADGFLSQTALALTETEIDTLALSSFVLACELATRFLNDYILGDPYFKINYPEHNLVRTRCQIELAKDMLKHMDEMNEIVKNYAVRVAHDY